MANGGARAAQHPARATTAGPGYARSAIAALLLMAAIVGVGATTATTSWRGRWHQDGHLIALVLELVLGALLAAVLLADRRAPQARYPAARLRVLLRSAIALTMVIVAVVAYVNLVAHQEGSRLLNALGGGHQRRVRLHRYSLHVAPVHVDFPIVLYAVIAVILLAAVVACVRIIVRRQYVGPAGFVGDDDDEAASLRQAVESGQAALRAVDDAQAAIIACYVAMESSLATAGTARMAAETPGELLARAAAAGLVHGTPASRLTELFYEARFSTHAMPQTAREEARQCLDAISADLARPAAADATA